jgi:exopolysaccharide biosynthesis protein
MKQLLFILFTIAVYGRSAAQSDSLAFSKGVWTSRILADGVVWRSVHFAQNGLFGANELINTVEIAVSGLRTHRLSVVHSDSLQRTSQLAGGRDALAAINGSFFKMRGADPDYHRELNGVPKQEPSRSDHNRSIVYLREGDSVISENMPDKDHVRKRHQQGSIAIGDEGISILKGDPCDLNWEHGISARDVMSTGPVMLLSGIEQDIPDDAFCRTRHPRTALGRKADGTIVLLVVDGRAVGSAGMSISELQHTMRWLGCVDAINLDGGGSSTMYIKGEPYAGVVNYPADNKKFDHEGEREVANAIVLERRQSVSLTLVPPDIITDKVKLDIRAGIRNEGDSILHMETMFYLDREDKEHELHRASVEVPAGGAKMVRFFMPAAGHAGKHRILLTVKDGGSVSRASKEIRILTSAVRSTRTIGGAWISFYHWSETEGKKWNPVIKTLTDDQWKEMVGSMHKIGMDIIVIQESFRNQAYVGGHSIEEKGYEGKAYYPSSLFPGRMPIAAKDPIEAVLAEADRLGMHVFMGVGMYAWFDYTRGSLAWHKKVARELWRRYGHHASFYGFYVSEEGMGSLDCFEKEPAKQARRRKEVLDFFAEFTPFCRAMAPGKPVMFAPNGWGVGHSEGAYPRLLKDVDIICPFAFARMPAGDLSGKEAIRRLQQYCDDAGAHLWLDLEAFLFNEKEGYLYPRPMAEIKQDLALFSNFEKVICYQYPGVFNDPAMSVQVGEDATVRLYLAYQKYLERKNYVVK